MPELIPAPRVSFDLSAEEYSRLALAKHDASCRECGRPGSDSRCGLGARYEAATRTSNDDIPGYRVGI
jgi:hypothetical protein